MEQHDDTERMLVQRVVKTYLEREAPDQLEDFGIAFEAVYRAASHQLVTAGGPEFESGEPRLPFGPELVEGSLILVATTLTLLYLRQGTRAVEHLEGQVASLGKDLATLHELLAEKMAAGDLAPLSAGPIQTVGDGVDFELRVTSRTGGEALRLDYVVHSPNRRFELSHLRCGSVHLSRPGAWQERIHHKLEELHQGYDAGGAPLTQAEAMADLEGLGEDLAAELFPPELQRALQEVEQAETMALISDEPWIPWEIVKPYDGDGPGSDGGFLGSRFQLTRWLAGARPPSAGITADRLLVIEAGSPAGPRDLRPLRRAVDEVRFLEQLAERHGVEPKGLAGARHPDVLTCLRDLDFGWIHFVGYGEHVTEDPADSGLRLAEGRALRPRHLRHDVQRRLRQNRPLVFLNACQAGREGQTWARPAGWARKLVLEAGCGALVAPLWPVADDLAHTFSKTFYQALERGETFGEARRTAQLALPEDSLERLAYALWADPHGRLLLGDASSARSQPATSGISGKSHEARQEKGSHGSQPNPRGAEPKESARNRVAASSPKRSRTLWAVVISGALLLAALASIGRYSTDKPMDGNGPVEKEALEQVSVGRGSRQLTNMAFMEHLDVWVLAMFGLGMFFWVVFKIVEKSKVGQFDGDQTLRFFRFAIALPFLLALAGLVVLMARSSGSTERTGEAQTSREETVRRLTLGMKSKDPTESRQAMEALVPYGDPAAREIVQAISEEAGVLAAEMFGGIKDGWFKAILGLLGPKPWESPFMAAAIEALTRMGEPAIEPILEQLGAESLIVEDTMQQAQAIQASQAQQPEAGATDAIGLIEQWNFAVRGLGQNVRILIVTGALEQALSNIGPVAAPALLDGLESPRWLVFQVSLKALSGMPEAYEPAARRLRDRAASSENEVEAQQLLSLAEAFEAQAKDLEGGS